MRKLALTAALGAACLGLAACGERDRADTAGNETAATGEGSAEPADANASATASASGSFPKGARIVEENGVTYRIDADGTRVRLGENDARIVVEKDVRYRVDPDGTRVRIDPDGAAIDVDLPDVTPDIDVGINKKGNPDVDVKTDRDGDTSPN